MNDYQQKLFNKFHDTGLGVSESEQSMARHFKHIISTYDWNYKKMLPENKKAAILDLGCGLGEFLAWLDQEGYSNHLGVDVSRQMLDIAKTQTKANLKNVTSAKDFLSAINEEYDLIVLNDVIEHLSKQEIMDTLIQAGQALKTGGRLIVKTNNLAAITGSRMRYSDFTHEVGLTEYSLKQILLAANFREVEIKPFAMPLTNFFRYIKFMLQKISNLCWKLRFWVNFTPVPKVVDEMIFAVAAK